MDRLAEIIAHKRREIQPLLARAETLRVAALERNDYRSLEAALDSNGECLRLIAEVKKASPSAGVISPDFDPVQIAKTYAAAGAHALSILTDEEFFQGRLEYLTRIRQEVALPCLRKDFIIHEAQIFEAAVAGADAVLLIVAALSQEELLHLLDVAARHHLDALVEVHDAEELRRALDSPARLIGINNRNLKTFEVDLATTHALAEEVEEGRILISESGIKTVAHAREVFRGGADAILVGESLMRSGQVVEMVEEFISINRISEPVE
ncbi:MAG: indole-3-glycerol phosphate synthase TrpC [Verrucomicrobiota bacterium]